jgi:LCP family protein required for cell wall assembly
MRQKPGKPDILRIIALLLYLFIIIYVWLFIFVPRAIPPYLMVFAPKNKINILVMGLDATYDEKHNLSKHSRTDTLILAQIDPFLGKIGMLSIPRDSYVDIPDHGKNKINVAYAYGSEDLTIKTVSNFLDVDINGYITIDPGSVTHLIDSIGGLKLYVEKDMYYKDSWGHLNINLKQGFYKLNGEQVQGYIRFRHDRLGDISRIKRQQIFLKALSRKLASPSVLVRLPWILPAIKDSIRTDLSFFDMLRIGNFARMINTAAIKVYTIPGNFSSENSPVSYWVPDIEKKDALMREMRVW